jgi:hypothetical protein
MAYTLDLTGSWAKLKWAKRHINQLRAEITEAGKGDPKRISLRRQYEPDQRAVVYRIDRFIEVRDYWGLMVGDALHNLRGALDHLAWQLALRHFNGVAPTDMKIIRHIQFPIVSDKNNWPTHVHRKHMDAADADKLAGFQPFNLGPISRASGQFIHPTESIALVNDIDKHRLIHLPFVRAQQGHFVGPGPEDIRDCVPVMAQGAALITLSNPGNPPHPGDEVARVHIVAVTGPNPDVDLHAHATGYIAFSETWDVIDSLDSAAETVAMILKTF